MTLFFYTLAFTAFSGLGVTFLNSESLLAVCFFVFLALCLQNSAPVCQGLQHDTQAVHAALLQGMLDSKRKTSAKIERLAKQSQLLASIKALTT